MHMYISPFKKSVFSLQLQFFAQSRLQFSVSLHLELHLLLLHHSRSHDPLLPLLPPQVHTPRHHWTHLPGDQDGEDRGTRGVVSLIPPGSPSSTSIPHNNTLASSPDY